MKRTYQPSKLVRKRPHGDGGWPQGDRQPPRQGPEAAFGLILMAAGQARLKRRAEFLRAASSGRKAAMPGLVLQVLTRQDEEPARLGFTVTKKVGNAVVRNRTRRRLREAARVLLRDTKLAGVDLVLIGRDATRTRNFALLTEDLRRALAKLGVAAKGQP